jgi:putative ABC transport system permease protein
LLQVNTLISGRYPILSSEIVLGNIAAQSLGVGVGDWVEVSYGENSGEFIVTGIQQAGVNNGLNSLINAAGFREIVPQFEFAVFNIYLTAGTDAPSFAETISESENGIISRISLARISASAFLDTAGAMFGPIAYAIIVVTAAVVILVLFMVIKTTILRKRRDLGIQKALGFTTLQLMNQIALNITPSLIIGVIAGAIGAFIGFNPIFAAITGGMGIVRTNLPIPIDWTFIVCVGLILLAYAVSMLIAWRIRKISAYALVSE